MATDDEATVEEPTPVIERVNLMLRMQNAPWESEPETPEAQWPHARILQVQLSRVMMMRPEVPMTISENDTLYTLLVTDEMADILHKLREEGVLMDNGPTYVHNDVKLRAQRALNAVGAAVGTLLKVHGCSGDTIVMMLALEKLLGLRELRRTWFTMCDPAVASLPWLSELPASKRPHRSVRHCNEAVATFISRVACAHLYGFFGDLPREILWDLAEEDYARRVEFYHGLPRRTTSALATLGSGAIHVNDVEHRVREGLPHPLVLTRDTFVDRGLMLAFAMLSRAAEDVDDDALWDRYVEILPRLMWGIRSCHQRLAPGVHRGETPGGGLYGDMGFASMPGWLNDPHYRHKHTGFLEDLAPYYGIIGCRRSGPSFDFETIPPGLVPSAEEAERPGQGLSAAAVVFMGKLAPLRWVDRFVSNNCECVAVCGEAPTRAAHIIWREYKGRTDKTRAARQANKAAAQRMRFFTLTAGHDGELDGQLVVVTSALEVPPQDALEPAPVPDVVASTVSADAPMDTSEPAAQEGSYVSPPPVPCSEPDWPVPDEVTLVFFGDAAQRMRAFAELLSRVMVKHPDARVHMHGVANGSIVYVDISGRGNMWHNGHCVWHPESVRLRLINTAFPTHLDALLHWDQTYLQWGFDGEWLHGSLEAWAAFGGGNWYTHAQENAEHVWKRVEDTVNLGIAAPLPSFYVNLLPWTAPDPVLGSADWPVCERLRVAKGFVPLDPDPELTMPGVRICCSDRKFPHPGRLIASQMEHLRTWAPETLVDMSSHIIHTHQYPPGIQYGKFGANERYGFMLDLVTVVSLDRTGPEDGIHLTVKFNAGEEVEHQLEEALNVTGRTMSHRAWYKRPPGGVSRKRKRGEGYYNSCVIHTFSHENRTLGAFLDDNAMIRAMPRGSIYGETIGPVPDTVTSLQSWREMLEPGDIVSVCGMFVASSSFTRATFSRPREGESLHSSVIETVEEVDFYVMEVIVHDAPTPGYLTSLALGKRLAADGLHRARYAAEQAE